MEKPARQKGIRALAYCLIAGMSVSGCTLLGVDYDSTSTEQVTASGFDGRVQTLESRLDRLENKIDALEDRTR